MKSIDMWTDGSSIKKGKGIEGYHGGAGIVLNYNGTIKKLSIPIEDATNNIAELSAAIYGLKSLKEPCHITLRTDSRYVINCITKWASGWKKNGWKTQANADVKNKHLIVELYELCMIHSVEWVWVKGHSDDTMNNLADELACEASASLRGDTNVR
jgi:ribonuclease HI